MLELKHLLISNKITKIYPSTLVWTTWLYRENFCGYGANVESETSKEHRNRPKNTFKKTQPDCSPALPAVFTDKVQLCTFFSLHGLYYLRKIKGTRNWKNPKIEPSLKNPLSIAESSRFGVPAKNEL